MTWSYTNVLEITLAFKTLRDKAFSVNYGLFYGFNISELSIFDKQIEFLLPTKSVYWRTQSVA